MDRRTLARYRFTGGGRFARTSAEGGGGGSGAGGGTTGTGTDGTGTGGSGSDAGAGTASGTGTGTASGTGDRGFPENTPLVEMSVEQREAYHRYHSRKWQERAEARSDYDQQKADAERWRQFQQSQQTPSERQIQEARDAGKAEAAAAANAEQVQNLLRVSLSARGVTADVLEDLVTAANPAAFITDGKVSADKVSTYASRLAGGSNAGGGGGGGRPDLGQGRREGGGKPSVSAGRDLFADRNKSRQTA